MREKAKQAFNEIRDELFKLIEQKELDGAEIECFIGLNVTFDEEQEDGSNSYMEFFSTVEQEKVEYLMSLTLHAMDDCPDEPVQWLQ